MMSKFWKGLTLVWTGGALVGFGFGYTMKNPKVLSPRDMIARVNWANAECEKKGGGAVFIGIYEYTASCVDGSEIEGSLKDIYKE